MIVELAGAAGRGVERKRSKSESYGGARCPFRLGLNLVGFADFSKTSWARDGHGVGKEKNLYLRNISYMIDFPKKNWRARQDSNL